MSVRSYQAAWLTPPHALPLPHPRSQLRLVSPRSPPKCLIPRSKVPLALTYARIAAIPLLFVTHAPPPLPAHPALSALLFAAASLTDFLDGYLARLWRVETSLGAFLDPVADKLLVAVALALIIARGTNTAIFLRIAAPVAAAVILAREVFVSALREYMALRGASAVVQVSIWGKVKTATQMLAVTSLLYAANRPGPIAALGIVALVVSAFLAVSSAAEYTVAAVRAVSARSE